MSSQARASGSQAYETRVSMPYDDLREKVAALFRPERGVFSHSVSPASPGHHGDAPLHPSAVDAMTPMNRSNVESTIHDLGSACDILSRATSCFDFLSHKVEQVESERDDAFAQLEEHRHAVSTWQEMIETAQSRMRDAERDLSALRLEVAAQHERANAAEDRAAQLESTLKLRDRRMSDLERSYTSLHGQVMSSFGAESPTYRAIETLVDRFRSKAA